MAIAQPQLVYGGFRSSHPARWEVRIYSHFSIECTFCGRWKHCFLSKISCYREFFKNTGLPWFDPLLVILGHQYAISLNAFILDKQYLYVLLEIMYYWVALPSKSDCIHTTAFRVKRGVIATRTTFLLTAPLFLTFLTSNFPTLFVLLNFILWSGSFLKIPSEKRKNIRKTTQNAFAPSIFIVLSIVLKLGTPLLQWNQAKMWLFLNNFSASTNWFW